MATATFLSVFRPLFVLTEVAIFSMQTLDTNSHFIAKLMFRRGIDLKRIAVIPDEEDAIIKTVKELSEFVGPSGYVFTTGGIGPTHDDITYESIVRPFDGCT